jgi:integrase/recombinase XerC
MTTDIIIGRPRSPSRRREGLLLELARELEIDGRAPSPTIAQAIPAFLETLAVGKSPQTVTTYRTALRRFCEFLASAGLSPDATPTSELPADILERFTVAAARTFGIRNQTMPTYLNGIRAFYRWLYARDIGPRAASYEQLKLRLQEVTGRYVYHGRKIDRRLGEVVARVLAPLPVAPARGRRGGLTWRERDIEQLRDRALLLTLYCTGARVSEVVGLNRADLDDGRADQALVLGKGNQERVIFFDGRTLAAIRAYLAARVDPYVPLFLRHNRARGDPGPAGEGYRLEPQSAWLRVRKYADALGIKARPHDFRHALARRMLANGAGMGDIQGVLGHQSIAVTSKIYARHDTRQLREAYDRFAGTTDQGDRGRCEGPGIAPGPANTLTAQMMRVNPPSRLTP